VIPLENKKKNGRKCQIYEEARAGIVSNNLQFITPVGYTQVRCGLMMQKTVHGAGL
jgi:hypothetical protein